MMNSEPLNPITDEHIRIFREDGVVCFKGLVDAQWLDYLGRAIEDNLECPGPLSREYADEQGGSARFAGDQFCWLRHAAFEKYCLRGPGVVLAAKLMGASSLNIFFDHLLVKEPGSMEPTPWHQDAPYWQPRGDQICSVWLAFDAVSLASGGVQYIRGSHLWGKRFAPITFSRDPDYYESGGLEPVPPADELENMEGIISFDLQPGDCVVHDVRILHGAPGNSTRATRRRGYAVRYCGDDVVWHPEPQNAPIIRDPGLQPGDPLDCALFPRVYPPVA